MLIYEECGNLLKRDLAHTTKICSMLYHGAATIKLYKESHYLYNCCNISCHIVIIDTIIGDINTYLKETYYQEIKYYL